MKFFTSLFVLTLFLGISVHAQPVKIDKTGLNRPVVAVVLSGGGAKGLAHIGALKVLEEVGIPVDLIVGTSMGAVVGSLYAIGYSPDSLQQIVKRQDWAQTLTGLNGFTPQSILSATGQEGKYAMTVQLKRGSAPNGLLPSQNIAMMIAGLTFRADSVHHFLKLPIPFACIGTDVGTGKGVLLYQGSLGESVQASMAFPGVFSPVEIEGRLLFDGGVARNLPVKEAFDLGADLVIAIDVGWEPQPVGNVKSFGDLVNQAVGIWVKDKTQDDRTAANILISPNVEGFNSFSFRDADNLIQRGYIAADSMRTQLVAMRERYHLTRRKMPYQFPLYKKLLETNRTEIRVIDRNITDDRWHDRYVQRGAVYEDLIRFTMDLKPDEMFTTDELNWRLEAVRDLKIFSALTYYIEKQHGEKVLVIEAVHENRDQVGGSFHYDPFLKGSVLLGGEMTGALGRYPAKLEAEIVLRDSWAGKVLPSFMIKGSPLLELRLPVRFGELQQYIYAPQTTYKRHETSFVNFGSTLNMDVGHKWDFEVGIRREIFEEKMLRDGEKDLVLRRDRLLNFGVELKHKGQINEFEFLDIGSESVLSAQYNIAASGHNFTQLMFLHRQTFSVKAKIMWFWDLQMGVSLGDDPPLHDSFVLGGFTTDLSFGLHHAPLYGYRSQYLLGQNMQFASTGFRFMPYKQGFIEWQVQGGRTPATNFFAPFEETDFNYGTGFTLGYNIPRLGTFKAAVLSDFKTLSLGLSIGRLF